MDFFNPIWWTVCSSGGPCGNPVVLIVDGTISMGHYRYNARLLFEGFTGGICICYLRTDLLTYVALLPLLRLAEH